MKFLIFIFLAGFCDAQAADDDFKKKVDEIFENAKPKVMVDVEVTEFTKFITPSGDKCHTYRLGERIFISCIKK